MCKDYTQINASFNFSFVSCAFARFVAVLTDCSRVWTRVRVRDLEIATLS